MLLCVITPANESDAKAGQIMAEYLNKTEEFSRMQKILGDKAYSGVGNNLRVPVSVEASERKEGQKGFVPEAFRWAVERTFAWFNRQRRVVRNYEKNSAHQASMNYIANIRICLKRLEKLA